MTHPFQLAIKEPWVLASLATYETMEPSNMKEFTQVSAQMFGRLLDEGKSLTEVSNLLFTMDCLWKFWRGGAQCFELTESLALALSMTDPGDIEWNLPYDAFWIGFGGAKFEDLMTNFFDGHDEVVNIGDVSALTREAIEGIDDSKRVRVYNAEGMDTDYNSVGCYVSRIIDEDETHFEVNIHAIDPKYHITSGTQVMVGRDPTSPLGRLLKNLCLYLSTPEAKLKAISERQQKSREMLDKAVHTINTNPGRLEALGPWIAKKTKPSVTRVGGNNELGESTGSGGGGGVKSAHWVRGHWRQQWYGSAESRAQRPKWIRPHRRGGVPDEGLRTYEVQS